MKSILTSLVLVLLLIARKDVLAAPTYTIPVVVHVLYNTGYAPLSNISDAQVLSQIDVLNQDFQLLNADAVNVPAAFAALKADCQIQFTLAKRDPLGNPTNGILHKSTTKTLFSQSLNDVKFSAQGGDDAWPSNQYLNIWLVASMVLDQKQDKGYTQTPGGAAATDGVAMYFSSFGTLGAVNLDSKGHIATHLVGHWLNLQHPWGPGADNPTCTATDDVADTPPQSGPSGTSFPYTAPAFPHISCGNSPNGDLFMNFMDWTAEASRCMFTQGQKARMQAVLAPGGARASLASSQGSTPPVNIPVVVHVLYNPGAPQTNISDVQIQSQIDVLNQDFGLLNADAVNVPAAYAGLKADCKIQFSLAKRDPLGSGTTGIIHKSTAKTVFNAMANDAKINVQGGNDAWPTDQYLNIWVVPALGGSPDKLGAGYAQSPGGGPAAMDGVVIRHNAFGKTGTAAAPFNKGRIATHMVGHWLGLYHPWGPGPNNSSCTASDYIGDTPNQGGPNYGCPSFPRTSCPLLGGNVFNPSYNPGDLFMNFMDYTDDACSIMFTQGQKERMQTVLAPGGFRASLASSQGGATPGCNAPAGLNVTNITSTGVTLGWNSVATATNYTVQWKTAASSTWNTILGIGGITRILSSLTQGTAYSFKVLGNCGAEASAYSNEFPFTTICPVPTGLTATNITSTGATLGWISVATASNYTVQWKTAANSTWNTIPGIAGMTRILSSLTPGTSYTFKVLSNCGGGAASAYSNEFPFTTTCPPPTGLNITGSGSTSVTFHWNGFPAGSPYTLQWGASGIPYTTVTNIVDTFYNLGLTGGAEYKFKVSSSCGGSTYSNEVAFIPNCLAPPIVQVTYISSISASISWIKVQVPIFGYVLQWKLAGAPTYNNIFPPVNGATTSYSFTGLTAGTSYTVDVMSNCSGLFSSPRIGTTFTTPAFKPTNLPNTNLSDKFTLYPNPTRGEVSFEYDSKAATIATISIIDQSARTCKTIQVKLIAGQNKPVFNISDLSKGLYFVRMVANEETLMTKLFLER